MSVRDDERRLRSLSARALDELVEDLAQLQQRELRGEPVRVPRVTLHLSSGRELSGMVLQLTQLRHGAAVLVRTGAQTRHEAGADATYVPLSAIEALTVHEAASHAEALSRGAPEPSSLEPPPTRLAARRAVEGHRRELTALLLQDLGWEVGIDGTPDGEPLRALVRLSADVASALKATAGDELGRSAITSSLQRVVLVNGQPAGVALEEGVLRVTSPFHQGPGGQLPPRELRAAIEKLL